MEIVEVGATGVAQVVIGVLPGPVIVQLTPLLGCVAPTTPVTVLVKVMVPPRTGLDEVASVIAGGCLVRVKVIGLLEIAR